MARADSTPFEPTIRREFLRRGFRPVVDFQFGRNDIRVKTKLPWRLSANISSTGEITIQMQRRQKYSPWDYGLGADKDAKSTISLYNC